MPLAWRLFACLLLTFLPICSLPRNPGQPGLGSGSRTTNSQTIEKKNSLALKKAPKICLGLLVFQLLMNAEEKRHLLVLHPEAHLPPKAFSIPPHSVSPKAHSSTELPFGLLHLRRCHSLSWKLSPPYWLVKSSWSQLP